MPQGPWESNLISLIKAREHAVITIQPVTISRQNSHAPIINACCMTCPVAFCFTYKGIQCVLGCQKISYSHCLIVSIVYDGYGLSSLFITLEFEILLKHGSKAVSFEQCCLGGSCLIILGDAFQIIQEAHIVTYKKKVQYGDFPEFDDFHGVCLVVRF